MCLRYTRKSIVILQISRNELSVCIMREYGVRTIQSLYAQSKSCVRVLGSKSDSFQVGLAFARAVTGADRGADGGSTCAIFMHAKP